MIKVAKFGGSSVANAKQFEKVKNIVESDPSRKFIVTSACGKESHEDHKVTDLLYLIQAHIKYGVSYENIFELIVNKYQSIKDALHLTLDLDKEFEQIRKIIQHGEAEDYLVSRGEYLTGKLLAEYLGAQFVDAQDVIMFKYDGTIDMQKTTEKLQEYAKSSEKILVPGFYGALPNGTIKVMSRGGSDITGAVIANIIDADVYENWTDVSGFMVVDPRIVPNSISIPRITYSELREMCYMGANVLHDDSVFPVKEKNIPINIRNTNDPSHPGTMIMEDCSEMDKVDMPHLITGITGRKNYTVISLMKAHSSAEIGFLRKLLTIFEKYNVSIEAVPVTVDTYSIVVQTSLINHCLYEILGELRKELKPEDLRVEDHQAMIAVVGREMKQRSGISGQLLSEFGRNHINIRTISQSSYELTIMIGVEDKDFEKAIKAIYDKFVLEEEKI